MKIYGSTLKVLDAALGGQPVTALKAWFDFAKGQKNVTAWTDNGVSGIEVNARDVTTGAVLLALANSFTVEGAPIFIKMDIATYEGDVPEGIRNRIDPADDSVRWWKFWHDEYHNHMDAADGGKIVPGNSWGEELSSTELQILLLEGYDIRLGHELGDWVAE